MDHLPRARIGSRRGLMMTPSELRPGDLIEWRYCDAWRAVKLGEVRYSPVCGCYSPLDGLHLLIAHVDQVLTFMSPTTGGTKLHLTCGRASCSARRYEGSAHMRGEVVLTPGQMYRTVTDAIGWNGPELFNVGVNALCLAIGFDRSINFGTCVYVLVDGHLGWLDYFSVTRL